MNADATAADLEPACIAAQLTPEWLGRALGRPVRAARVEPVGTGQIGAVYRVHLDGVGVPERVLAKLPAADPGTRAMLAGPYRQEVAFYTRLAATVAVRVPRCHHAVSRGDSAEFTLLLEDLAPATPGDQIAGCGYPEAAAAVRNLAGLHAPRWCDPALLDEPGLSLNGPGEAAMLADLYGPALDTFLARLGDRLDPADAGTLRACAAGSSDWLVARPERFALVHGDYRLDNLLFDTRGGGTVTAVDWQTLGLGLPARDLAYFVGTALDPADRARHEDALVEQYWRALCELGVTGYTLGQCRRDYVFAMPQGPLVAVFGAAYGTPSERGDAMFAAMVRRSCAAIRELGSLATTPG
ncbi:phosphotransferase family protein [Nocardia farcinica]|uniref:phosphotransferase family protein n=1 Tax=Nocardia farcinica TaxID=37329 RepID=UPI0018930E74|nr:phosphotransferase [Nocardia farcinica]MBF6290525.1 phosphotransferase [Nocardia farcinica]MBF6377698.1 phosphotransferase [Nocardia farcinica]